LELTIADAALSAAVEVVDEVDQCCNLAASLIDLIK
jgi:hypothetical protein